MFDRIHHPQIYHFLWLVFQLSIILGWCMTLLYQHYNMILRWHRVRSPWGAGRIWWLLGTYPERDCPSTKKNGFLSHWWCPKLIMVVSIRFYIFYGLTWIIWRYPPMTLETSIYFLWLNIQIKWRYVAISGYNRHFAMWSLLDLSVTNRTGCHAERECS